MIIYIMYILSTTKLHWPDSSKINFIIFSAAPQALMAEEEETPNVSFKRLWDENKPEWMYVIGGKPN
jgi:hypothetical protein